MKKLFLILFFEILSIFLLQARVERDSIVIKINNILNQKEYTAYQRFRKADSCCGLVSLEKAKMLYQSVMYNFCKNELSDSETKNRCLAYINSKMALLYNTENKNDSADIYFDLASKQFEKMPFDSYEKIMSFIWYADYQIEKGNIQRGHDYYWKAVKMCDNLSNMEQQKSFCYYQIATAFLQMHDCEGLRKMTWYMKNLMEETQNLNISYDYYSVIAIYYSVMQEDFPDSLLFRDSALYFNKQAIGIIENMSIKEYKAARIQPVWNYYNVAVSYMLYFDPPIIDSMELYLNKADVSKQEQNLTKEVEREFDISIIDLRAWISYYKKQYKKAENQMLYVVQLLDSVENTSKNTIQTEREQAYSFLVMLYEEMNRTDLALEYQKKLNDVNVKRFDIERNKALHELSIKYDVENKECQIQRLEEEKVATQRALWLTIGLCFLFLLAMVLSFLLFRLRRKNLNDRLYEKALETEISQQTLINRNREMELLQQEFDQLKLLSEKNKEDTDKYKNTLQNLQKQMNEALSKTMINHVMELIKGSHLSQEIEKKYIDKLIGLNINELDCLFATATQQLTTLDMKYIICFKLDIDVVHIANIFHVEPNTVYTVRHRIRKKFDKRDYLLF